ncbi:MAG: hypothetical protein Q8K72_07215, partial [Acidimicrobiales bacterium]|nr:hypothetical protein [Acidimicrobiales bacterium]
KVLDRARSEDNGLAGRHPALDKPGLEAALVELVAVADRLGIDLDEARRGVTLETVFFSLTGRDLRE